MKEQFPARMVRIHFGEDDKWLGKPLHEAIVAKCVELGMAGATVGVPGLLCAYRKGSKRCYGEDGAFGRTIGALHEVSSGNLWAGTPGCGMSKWNSDIMIVNSGCACGTMEKASIQRS